MWDWISKPDAGRPEPVAGALLALVLSACAAAQGAPQPPAAPAGSELEQANAVAATLDRLHAAAARADGRAYFDLFTPEAVFIGTDASERWDMAQFRAYADPIFAQGRGWTYHARTRSVTIAQIPCRCVAWFDEALWNEKYGTTRGSGVLVRRGGEWKIAQYVLSFPIPNDLAGEMTARIRAHEGSDPKPVR
jgi:hypothetical protein